MRSIKGLALALLAFAFIATACSKNEKTGGQTPTTEPPTNQVTAESAPPEEVEKALVDGCDGTGTVAGAKTAFDSSDYKEANRQARCVFNASVKTDPNNPNTEAAFYAFLSSVALGVESPQFNYIFDQAVTANQVFGPTANSSQITQDLKTRFPGNSTMEQLHSIFKYHEQKGHSVRDVTDQVAAFINERLPDWNTLLKAMAMDPKFLASKIPINFNGNSSEHNFTYTEASFVRAWVDFFRFVAKFYAHYDLGVTNADSFTDINALVQDMNTAPKLLSIKTTADGGDLVPYANLLLGALNLAIGNNINQPKESWLGDIGDIVPSQVADQLVEAVTVSQLRDSLQFGMTFLAATKLKIGIDLKTCTATLPDSAKVNQDVAKVDNGDLSLRDEFDKEFFKSCYVERP